VAAEGGRLEERRMLGFHGAPRWGLKGGERWDGWRAHTPGVVAAEKRRSRSPREKEEDDTEIK
jgi:hypothetical protein